MINNQFVFISLATQELHCFDHNQHYKTYLISTAKNGPGELMDSECTPRGWHRVHSRIGLDAEVNSVFVHRKWTGEFYSAAFAAANPNRDWILTRIIQLDGLEPGRNKGGQVDSLKRCIYIHGTPDTTNLNQCGSRGCIRMRNADIIAFVAWVNVDTCVCIE